MAVDILIMGTDVVPGGRDQMQHVEMVPVLTLAWTDPSELPDVAVAAYQSWSEMGTLLGRLRHHRRRASRAHLPSLHPRPAGLQGRCPHAQRAGHRTTTGGTWCAYQVLRVLSNRIYIGELTFREITVDECHTPLVDSETFEEAQRLLAERGEDHAHRRANDSDYQLTGLLPHRVNTLPEVRQRHDRHPRDWQEQGLPLLHLLYPFPLRHQQMRRAPDQRPCRFYGDPIGWRQVIRARRSCRHRLGGKEWNVMSVSSPFAT